MPQQPFHHAFLHGKPPHPPHAETPNIINSQQPPLYHKSPSSSIDCSHPLAACTCTQPSTELPPSSTVPALEHHHNGARIPMPLVEHHPTKLTSRWPLTAAQRRTWAIPRLSLHAQCLHGLLHHGRATQGANSTTLPLPPISMQRHQASSIVKPANLFRPWPSSFHLLVEIIYSDELSTSPMNIKDNPSDPPKPTSSSTAFAFRLSQSLSSAQAFAMSSSPFDVYWCVIYLCVSMQIIMCVLLINECIYYVPHLFVSHCCMHECAVWTCMLWIYMHV